MTRKCRIPTAASLAAILVGLIAGCTNGTGRIPKDAHLVASKSGWMGFLATRGNGTVYLLDADTGRVVYTADVAFGDKLVFLPQQKQILFNGNVISQSDLNEKHVYKLYFREDKT